MVMVPEAVKQQWEELRKNPVAYGRIFWDLWKQDWLPNFKNAQSIINSNLGHDMSTADAAKFYETIKKLTFFIDLLRAKQKEIILNKTVRDLIAHHVGNGIYKIFLLANYSDNDSESILLDKVERISTDINDLEIFWDDLEEVEKVNFFVKMLRKLRRLIKNKLTIQSLSN
jgi:hypothetical protein